jgi:hypothetical protein
VFDLNCCSSELHKQPGERDNPGSARSSPNDPKTQLGAYGCWSIDARSRVKAREGGELATKRSAAPT